MATAVAACLLAGCTPEYGDLRQWMDDEMGRMPRKIEPLPAGVLFESQPYEGRTFTAPDAERKLAINGASNVSAPDMARKREPLEQFPLELLSLRGVLREDGKVRAVVEADNRIFELGVGNYAGTNYGKVARIDSGKVVLVEQVQTPEGIWVEREQILGFGNSRSITPADAPAPSVRSPAAPPIDDPLAAKALIEQLLRAGVLNSPQPLIDPNRPIGIDRPTFPPQPAQAPVAPNPSGR